MIGSGTLTKQIASYLARTGYPALNDEALRATKDHILYTLGTIVAGSSAPGSVWYAVRPADWRCCTTRS